MAIRYWLGVVQRDHVLHGVALGIAQLNHGARTPLTRMGVSDGFVYYSPRVSSPDGAPLREFTAIGRMADEEIYQVTEASSRLSAAGRAMVVPAMDIRPWRRRVDWDHAAVAASIRPLLPALDLTRGNPNWGFQLRRGHLEISRHDFELIRAQMRPPSPDDHRR